MSDCIKDLDAFLDAVDAGLKDIMTQAGAAHRAREEAVLDKLCSGWVSGLDPVLVRDHRGDLVGLTHDGPHLSPEPVAIRRPTGASPSIRVRRPVDYRLKP